MFKSKMGMGRYQKQITRLETQLIDQNQDLNVVREIQTRLAWIEANCCR